MVEQFEVKSKPKQQDIFKTPKSWKMHPKMLQSELFFAVSNPPIGIPKMVLSNGWRITPRTSSFGHATWAASLVSWPDVLPGVWWTDCWVQCQAGASCLDNNEMFGSPWARLETGAGSWTAQGTSSLCTHALLGLAHPKNISSVLQASARWEACMIL